MTNLVTILAIIILFLFFFRIKWGIFLYLLFVFLIPSLEKCSIPFLQKWIVYNLAVLVSLGLITLKTKRINSIKQITPFLGLFAFYFVTIFLQHELPLDYQLGNWLGQFLRYLALPITLLAVYSEKNYDKLPSTALNISILVACIYGLFLLNLKGFNPYISVMLSDTEFLENYSQGGSGRLFGRISSVFPHPMTFGVFLICAFNYCVFKITTSKKRLDNLFFTILLIIVTVNACLCGVRSVIGGILASILTFVIANKKGKYFVYTTLFLFIAWFAISFNHDLEQYVQSIFESNKNSTVQGSSIAVRIEQLLGCFSEIQNNPFFGHGYNWTTYYGSIKGDHPIILAFESLIFVVLCNWGIVGCIAWVIFCKKVYQNIKKNYKENIDPHHMQLCLMVSYLSYTCITGDYGYMMYWTIFHCIIYLEELQSFKRSSYE